MAFVTADNLTALTREHVRKRLIDNIFTGNQYFFSLRASGAVKIDGGTQIEFPIVVNRGVADSYDRYDTLTTTDVDFSTTSTTPWRHYYAPVVYARTDQLRNMGKTQVFNLIDSKRRHAEMSLADKIGDDLAGDGTGNNNKAADGYRAMLSTTSTFQGLNPTTFTTWAASIDATTNTLTLAALSTQIGNQSIGGQKPTDIITTKAMFFEKVMAVFESAIQKEAVALIGPKSRLMADAGFTVVDYQGIPIWYDEKVPGTGAGTTDSFMILLNMNRYSLVLHTEDNFIFEPFRPATTQRAFVGYWFVTLNTHCEERRVQGAMTTLDPGL